ncbi:MAG: DUF116 domain-containing protein [Candidatus Hydrogenedentota bacterium]
MNQHQDRQLGDEWVDWDGEISSEIIDNHSSPLLFLSLSLVCFFISVFLVSFLYYLISPRLSLLGQIYLSSGRFLLYLILFLFAFFYLLILLKTIKKIKLPVLNKFADFFIGFFSHYSLKLGILFGIRKDKILNSYIMFNNSLIEKLDLKNLTKIMILLPRCLSKNIIEEIKKSASKFNYPVFIVPGGDLARAKIKEYKPDAIIAVACERDLYSGLKDTPSHIPVYAIPNIRPDGPCKNTCIDYNTFDKVLKLFR